MSGFDTTYIEQKNNRNLHYLYRVKKYSKLHYYNVPQINPKFTPNWPQNSQLVANGSQPYSLFLASLVAGAILYPTVTKTFCPIQSLWNVPVRLRMIRKLEQKTGFIPDSNNVSWEEYMRMIRR